MTLDPNESQLGQDTFALICCGEKANFVDIGCSRPDHYSNTISLLKCGWKGYGVDMGNYAKEWDGTGMLFRQGDATTIQWKLRTSVDYLSVDVDEASFLALKNFFDQHKWLPPICATVEHDRYRLGDSLLTPQRELMGSLGYVLVGNALWNFEDWYVHESHPLVNKIALELSSWGDEPNDYIELIPEFKNDLRALLAELI